MYIAGFAKIELVRLAELPVWAHPPKSIGTKTKATKNNGFAHFGVWMFVFCMVFLLVLHPELICGTP